MGKHREVLDILADVLKAAGSGASKTRIMFRANLSYKLLEKYLGMTIEKGLIGADRSNYRVSNKGKAFLNSYEAYLDQNFMVRNDIRELDILRERLEEVVFGSKGNNGNGNNGTVTIISK